MFPAEPVRIQIDLERVRRNATTIKRQVGVSVYAVVKANAYGLGLADVVRAIDAEVDVYCVFSLREAQQANLHHLTRKPIIAMGPPLDATDDDFRAAGVRPTVTTVEEASRLASARPLLCIDTGMQRFSCPPENVDAVLRAGHCDEAFTHATLAEHVHRLLELVGNRGLKLHAAASGLLGDPACWLDAVRPGIALYRDAVRITARLVDVRASRGPAGYTGFIAPHHGVILRGYSHGLRLGPCLVNGRRSRLLEVGMQSAFVEIQESDRVGDEVALLGDEVSVDDVAAAWKCSPQEVLVSLLR